MRRWSLRPPELSAPGDNPVAFCLHAITSVRSKADRNERMARLATITIILASAMIPVSLIISSQAGAFAWGKLIPSLLAATAATVAGFIQFERPHERWKLYRGYQRAFEAELFRYQNHVDPYGTEEPQRTRVFAAAVATLQERLHEDWSGLVPASAQVASRAVGSLPQEHT
jgi:hypothetical protein